MRQLDLFFANIFAPDLILAYFWQILSHQISLLIYFFGMAIRKLENIQLNVYVRALLAGGPETLTLLLIKLLTFLFTILS
jgi:hypothetical protein